MLTSSASIDAQRVSSWTGWLLIALGGAARFIQYFGGRPLWLDEAMLADNLAKPGFAHLISGLGNVQAAPPAFMLTSKLVSLMFGISAESLRMLPLCAGLGALVLFHRFACHTLPGPASAVAIAWFSLSRPLVYYCAEFKPYMVDVLFTMALLTGAMALCAEWSSRRVWLLGALGCAAPWFSYASVFSFPAIGAAVFVRAIKSRERMASAILTAIAWSISCGALYLVNLRPQRQVVSSLVDFWSFALAPRPLSFGAVAEWLQATWIRYCDYPLLTGRPTLMFALGLVALVVVATRTPRGVAAALLIGPLGVVVVAAMLRTYPLADRMLLFTVPLVILVLAHLLVVHRTSLRILFGAGLALALVPTFVSTVGGCVRPLIHEDIDAAVDVVTSQWQEGDVLAVDSVALPALRFCADYQARFGGYNPRVIPIDQITQLPAEPRIWYLSSHRENRPIDAAIKQLKAGGRLRSLFIAPRTTHHFTGEAIALLVGPPRTTQNASTQGRQ